MLEFIITLITFLVYDLTWIMFVAGPLFSVQVREIQGTPMTLNPYAGFIAYLLLALGTYWFTDFESPLSLTDIMKTAGIFGLVAYGIFDFTNLAIFSNYRWSTAIIDTIWGFVVCTISAYTAKYAYQQYRLYGST